jgi:hypothetical protein
MRRLALAALLTTVVPAHAVTVTPSGGDDTANIQAAVAAGGDVELAPGSFTVSGSATITLSNLKIHCNASVITAAPATKWPSGQITYLFGRVSGATLTGLEISGCRFAFPYGNPAYGGGYAHILNLAAFSGVSVHGGADFVSIIGSSNVFEQHNVHTNASNSCYDHWGGFTDVHVNANVCSTLAAATTGVAGIAFTGINTDQSAANSNGFEAIGNTIYVNNSNGQAIAINGHATGGTDDTGRIIGTKIVLAPGVTSWGILVVGHANHIEIADTVCSGGAGLFSCVGAYSPATGVAIHDSQTTSWQAGGNGIYANTSVGGSVHDNLSYSSSLPLLGSLAPTVTYHDNVAH